MIKIYFILFSVLLLILSCDNPKKIAPTTQTPADNQLSTGIFSDKMPQETKSQRSVATVKEILPTDKYIYIKIEQDNDSLWIATAKQELSVGEKISFNDGLVKYNFESKEYGRVFEKILLVSKILRLDSSSPSHNQQDVPVHVDVSQVKKHPKSISIKDIIENIDKYQNQEVIISGICSKLNANIMNRNWIHIKDGSKDDYDFVITSSVAIPEGHPLTMQGVIHTNVDFGAGYKYDIIMEDADIVK